MISCMVFNGIITEYSSDEELVNWGVVIVFSARRKLSVVARVSADFLRSNKTPFSSGRKSEVCADDMTFKKDSISMTDIVVHFF